MAYTPISGPSYSKFLPRKRLSINRCYIAKNNMKHVKIAMTSTDPLSISALMIPSREEWIKVGPFLKMFEFLI